MARKARAAGYTIGVGTTAGGLFSLNEVAVICGIAFTVITFLVNWRYQAKRHALLVQKREEEAQYHKARMKAFLSSKGSCEADSEN